MPASLVHMMISQKVRKELKNDPELKTFVEDVLEKNNHARYMELGSVGPDLPYYESMVKGIMDLVLDRSDKPMGVDQWSYQLHSKDPNYFPLKMIEIIWKETDIEKEDWEPDDHMKFAFVCGYLTHVAADQIIHPVVNLIAGPYYKRGESREKHRQCEVYQDVWLFDQLKAEFAWNDFHHENFNLWCDLNPGLGSNTTQGFRYLVQKTFIEAHAVSPSEDSVENWVDGILTMLRGIRYIGLYVNALENQGVDSDDYKTFIQLLPPPNDPEKQAEYAKFIAGRTYENFVTDAIELAAIYIKAAYKIYNADALDDAIRKRFLDVVQNADLGAPLQKDILQAARDNLSSWR